MMKTTTMKQRLWAAILSLSMALLLWGGIHVFAGDESAQTIEIGYNGNFDGEDAYAYTITAPSSELWTGNDATLAVDVRKSLNNDILRIYFQYDVAQYGDFWYEEITGIGDIPASFHRLENGLCYYDIGPSPEEQTLPTSFTFSYPNGSTGGHVTWWFVAAPSELLAEADGQGVLLKPGMEYGDIEISETAFETNWNTDRAEYELQKEPKGSWSMYLPEGGTTASVKNLSYQVQFKEQNYTTKVKKESAELGGYRTSGEGADYVNYVEYQDILELPDNLRWRWEEGSTPTFRVTNTAFTTSTRIREVYVTVDGVEYLLATLTVEVPGDVQTISLDSAGCEYKDGKAVLTWKVSNTKKNEKTLLQNDGEIENVITTVTYGPEVIIYDDYTGDNTDVKFELVNTATAKVQPFCSKAYESTDVVRDDKDLNPEGTLLLTKERTTSRSGVQDGADYIFFGEDVEYVITAQNESPFDYTKYATVTDNLDNFHYIKGESIRQMLVDEVRDDEWAEVVITHATLVSDITLETVTGADGTTTAQVGSQNMGQDSHYAQKAVPSHVADSDATITISNKNGVLTLKVKSGETETSYTIGEGYQYPSVDAAFQAIGYVVTRNATYTVNWYNDNERLERGTTRTYEVHATYKDTFMLLTEDARKLYKNADDFSVTWDRVKETTQNKAHVTDQEGEETEEVFPLDEYGREKTMDIRPDFNLQKGMSVANASAADDADLMFEDGSVLQYHLILHHNGTSDYDALPVVDQSTGAQALMAKVSENPNAPWANESQVKRYTYNGEEYYILMPPEDGGTCTYEGVWLSGYFVDDTDVKSYYADSVTVTRENDGKGSITTLVKWYMTEMWKGSITINYNMLSDRALLGCNPGLRANVRNWAYINDRDGHRLYDYKGGASFQLDFDKNIVTKKDFRSPMYDTLDQDRFTWISQNANQVTYRLDFALKGEGTLELTSDKFYDLLPNNAGFFKWNADNVKVSYLLMGDTAKVTMGGTDYETVNGKRELASPGTEYTITGGTSQAIRWNSDFSITLNTDANNQDRVYIYITLTFPGGADWEGYIKTTGTSTVLKNILYVEGWPVEVRHQLTEPGEAFLQKGVFETGQYVYNGEAGTYAEVATYLRRDDRTTYVNDIDRGNQSDHLIRGSVAYYLVLKNTSTSANLYLDTIYDVLPKGYEFLYLRNAGADDTWAYGVTVQNRLIPLNNNTYISNQGKSCILVNDGRTGKWVTTMGSNIDLHVSVADGGSIDGHNIVKFDIYRNDTANNGVAGVGYDTRLQKYYLEPGWFLVFGYECAAGLEEASEDVSYNAAAMPLVDVGGGVFSLDQATPVTIANPKNLTAAYNDGPRYLWSNDEALRHGFTAGSAGTQWLASDVTVYRGSDIVPGIEKTVDGGNHTVNRSATVDWTVKAYNEGTATLGNYQIVETMQEPYHFVGNITFTNHGQKVGESPEDYVIAKNSGANGMLQFGDRTKDAVSVTTNANYSAQLPLDPADPKYGVPVKLWFKLEYSLRYTETVPAWVSLTQDDMTETLTLTFEDPRWRISSKGHVELGIQTRNTTGNFKPIDKAVNEATLIPLEDTYNESTVTKGTNIKNAAGRNVGVYAEDYISVDVAAPTNSYKEVRDITSSQGGYAKSGDKQNGDRIVLDSTTHTVRYTLNVESSQNDGMDQLVIIDNLPESGDGRTLFGQERGSAFKVSLAADPQFEAVVYKKGADGGWQKINPPLPETQYVVQYRIGESSGGFDHNDWIGANADRWRTYDPNTTTAANLAAARDVRLVVYGLKADGTPWLPEENMTDYTAPATYALEKNHKIAFSFNAVIENQDPEGDWGDSWGDIAWNSFGYEYFMGVKVDTANGSTIQSHYLYASPSQVGISAPAVPRLTKKLINASGRPASVAGGETFAFIIYKGDNTVAFGGYDPDTVGKALQGVREFTYVTLSVEPGASGVERVKLANLRQYQYVGGQLQEQDIPWVWEDGQTYSIVELDSDYEHELTKVDGASGKDRNVSFTYSQLNNVELEYTNALPAWGVEIFKFNENKGKGLAGAVFGLFSPDETAQISADEWARWGFDGDIPTFKHGNMTYYLSQLAESGSDGRISDWTGNALEESSYIISELRYPEGYTFPSGGPEQWFVTYEQYKDYLVWNPGVDGLLVEAINVPGENLGYVTVSLDLTKTVKIREGFPYSGGTFKFLVIPDGGNGAGDPLDGPVEIEVVIPGGDDLSGTAAIFENTPFYEKGEYKYTVKEIEGDDYGVTYDDTEYEVVVTVGESEGKLTAATTITVKGARKTAVAFENKYIEQVTLPATGGMGTTVFYTAGVLMLLCAAAFLALQKAAPKGRRQR